jgi:dipeptidyl-peptidase 4
VHNHTQKQFKFHLFTSLSALCTLLDNSPADSAAIADTTSGRHGDVPKAAAAKAKAIAAHAPSSMLSTAGVTQAMVVPEVHKIRSRDGTVDLYCAVYSAPHCFTGNSSNNNNSTDDAPVPALQPAPCVVACYGGPHVQRVSNTWLLRADLRTQRLVQQGCVVIKCDNRGSNRRGIDFEAALHRNMGAIELQDQQTAVEHFVRQGLVDPKRVGMVGWSYGK